MSGAASGKSGTRANRLARESSPYLLQHAHNPVEWWAWGPEAFAEARRRCVPIFLSIGYSTCYWCHVMERESFEDEATAEVMNGAFVNVKVDREERPDVDDAYMAAVQMMTGHGGWPMSVFLEPEGLRPFWAGTYFPPSPRHGMPSFKQLLEGMSRAWRDERREVMGQAAKVAEAVTERLGRAARPVIVGPGQVAGAMTTLLTILDRTHGGFGGAPKFPQPAYCDLLLEARTAADEATGAAVDGAIRQTLDAMALGGVFDQAGGGFHRYSVDAMWLVPHFEKMLYDNGQLLETYARAAGVYGDAFYKNTARRIAGYALREMRAGDGAFFTAQDAEVDGREGWNYLWNAEEFAEALGSDAEWAAQVYGVAQGPNFRDPHHPEESARNVLRLEARPERIAERMGMIEAEFAERLGRVNRLLLAARGQRRQPRRDEKVIASWNGLMIAGLAEAGRALGDRELKEAGVRSAEAVLKRLKRTDGRLMRCERGEGEAIAGTLEDYATLAHGLAALARGSEGEERAAWVREAAGLVNEAERRLGDGSGGYFDAEEGASGLFVRVRTTYDGAMPCGASVMLNVLVSLHELTGHEVWLERARRCLASLSAAVAESPVATANATRGLLRLLRLDGEAVERHLRGLGAAPPVRDAEGEVTVWASANDVYVTPDKPQEITLRMEIPEGLHINAANAGNGSGGGLVPLRVAVVGGDGFKVYADYPEGEPLDGAGHHVHRGMVEFAVAVEAAGEISGRPGLVVEYQVCSDRACREPVRLRLDIELHQGEGPYAAGLA